MQRASSSLLLVLLASSPLLAQTGCAEGNSQGGGGSSSSGFYYGTSTGVTSSGSSTTGSGGSESGSGGAGGNGSVGAGGAGGGGNPGNVLCPAAFRFTPPAGAQSVVVAGEWNGFDLGTATILTGPANDGSYSGKAMLPPGLHAYKVVYQQAGGAPQWVLDPNQGRRKYVGGIENSAIKVHDCSKPSFQVNASQASRPAPGQGTFSADLGYVDGIDGSGPDAQGYEAILVHDDQKTPLGAGALTVDAKGNVKLSVKGLADGKYRVVMKAKSKSGKVGDPQPLVFWIEAEAFSWKDALIYMVMTDRYRDGNAANDPAPIPGADPRGDFKGGDLDGLRQAIEDGTLDALGVRAIWLTPFQTNPTAAYLAADGVHKVTGYHGYWPVKGREVDQRLGGPGALSAMVKAAHAHGIRILQDYVLNHVHEDHEYFKAHPEWFRDGCICGTANCDWTTHALDCKFASYMPDINHTVPEANAQFVADAIYWLDDFDLDGLRVDAVKHVEEVATRNLAAEVRETFESAGTRYFLMGETAMGWNDCADPCNDENYGTIAKYIGPFGLDGQFDFVLYHGVSYRTFAWGDKGMLHADYWFKHGMEKWPQGAIMTPYIGSHDTPRFATIADYADGDRGIPGNQWDNTAVAPTDAVPYERTRIGMAWLLGLPGAPLLYYGDEYGQWGGADPNNRMMWRPEGSLSPDEKATLSFVRKLGAARKAIPAMRRGDYVTLNATEDTLVFGRKVSPGNAAIVAFTRAASPVSIGAEVTASLGIAAGTKLKDAMGGSDVFVGANGQLSLNVPAKGAMILAP
jgi:glycosidase